MKVQWILVLAGAMALSTSACKGDDSTNTSTDGGTDTGIGDTDMGTGSDMGRDMAVSTDMGRTDSGAADPCESTGDGDLTAFVGCNGAPIGASAAADSFGGSCTPGGMANPAGSCTNTGGLCAAGTGEPTGFCLQECEPSTEFYTTTSTCPSGSRCFTVEAGVAVCYPDCASGSDCLSGSCDNEGSCRAPSTPVTDGGTPDAGDVDASDVDAGASDAGDVDAGVADDAGPLPVAVIVPCEGATIAQTVSASAGEGFGPSTVTVPVGSVVQFNNSDGFGHTVTSRTSLDGEPVADDLFNFALPGSASICVNFTTFGTYPYYCNIHTSMRGAVYVGVP